MWGWTQGGDQRGRMTKRVPRTRVGLSNRWLRRPHHPCPSGGADEIADCGPSSCLGGGPN
jgi:hypothetical protein